MVHELLELLPPDVSTLMLWVAIGGVVVGAGLWLAGSRISRGLITLMLVAGGALAGLRLPGWMGWEIDPMGPAVVLALVLGLSGFVLHRMWIAAGLGLTLAAWAVLACWVAWGDPAAIESVIESTVESSWASADQQPTFNQWVANIRESQPPILWQVLPWAAGIAVLSGIAVGLVWQRIALILLYSLVGVSMVVGLGMLLVQARQPAWIDRLPQQTWIQLSIVAALVVLGMAAQWRFGLPPAGGTDEMDAEVDG